MGQLSRLLLSGLVALSLTFAATAAHASWSASISDVMNLVYCLVGAGDCDGLAPASTVDITTDNQASYGAGCVAAGGIWDGSSCLVASLPTAEPNCWLLGLCYGHTNSWLENEWGTMGFCLSSTDTCDLIELSAAAAAAAGCSSSSGTERFTNGLECTVWYPTGPENWEWIDWLYSELCI